MIDIILQGTSANLQALLRGRGLIDAENNPAPGFDYCLWGGSGKFMTVKPTYDANGVLLTPANYMSGVVMIARISADEDIIGEGKDQWQRSRVAQWFKANGVLGTVGGLPCYMVNNVRMLRPTDVFSWCEQNNMPSHEWLGGNKP